MLGLLIIQRYCGRYLGTYDLSRERVKVLPSLSMKFLSIMLSVRESLSKSQSNSLCLGSVVSGSALPKLF